MPTNFLNQQLMRFIHTVCLKIQKGPPGPNSIGFSLNLAAFQVLDGAFSENFGQDIVPLYLSC